MKTKVICVSTGGVPYLTLHKIYDGFISRIPVLHSSLKEDSTIQVVDDRNRVTTYKRERFMELDEFRENKLKELGI
jgi:hypothetical protein